MSIVPFLIVIPSFFCYPKCMKSRKKHLPYLFIAILSFVGLLLLVATLDPHKSIDVFVIMLPPLFPFFSLIFLTVSCLFTFLLKGKRRGILIGLFSLGFLLLQFFRFNSIFYTLLLIIITILIELLFWKKKQPKE